MSRRSQLAICLAAGLVTVLSACGPTDGEAIGTNTPPTSTGPTGTPSATQPPAETSTGAPEPTSETDSPVTNAKCTAKDLKGSVAHEDGGAGQRYAMVTVTNKSDSTCTMYGYGGLQLIDELGNPTPTKLTRVPQPGPSLVTLDPGQSATKELHWTAVRGGNDQPKPEFPCQPPSGGARIIPPDDTKSLEVKYDFGEVCLGGHLEGSAYAK